MFEVSESLEQQKAEYAHKEEQYQKWEEELRLKDVELQVLE